ncbi:MAG: class I SAM-dependent methyltransferase [Pyrinomonadaceae bacterium]
MNKPLPDDELHGGKLKDSNSRLSKVGGIDYKRGAIEYPARLAPSDRHHLLTKPFYNLANKISRWSGDGLDEDTQRHFTDFANMAYALALPSGARILDVGCGSGWLCEYFARLGYEMMGIDLSPDMIAIARERVNKVSYGADHETELRCRFLVHNIETAPLSQRFDAILCYDALHHFEDENAVLANISTMMDPGGQLFVMEGEKPPEGSEMAAELRSVMRQYETLESPFEGEYLRELLQLHGFAIVGDYVAFRGLVDRESVVGNTVQFMEPAAVSYLLCRKIAESGEPATLPDTRNPGRLRADLSLRDNWARNVVAGSRIETCIEVKNAGDTLWLVSRAPLTGRVKVGLKILNSSGETIAESHGVPPLQHALAPGERVLLSVNIKAPEALGQYTLKIDLVNQNICWFEEHGSQPLILPFDVAPRS